MRDKEKDVTRNLVTSLCTLNGLVLGNDSAGGAGVSASTAVQAGSSVDNVLVVALRDSASGASVSATAAAHASRSDLVCHGSTSIRICKPIVA